MQPVAPHGPALAVDRCTRDRAVADVAEAAERGGDLLVFPEAHSTYDPRADVQRRIHIHTLMAELSSRRILVTGATSGLGAAMASALVDAGARVMVTGRDRARVHARATELGSSAIACRLDVRDERSVAACAERARQAWGGIDMLVNNAGIGMRTVNPRFLSEPSRSGRWRRPGSGT